MSRPKPTFSICVYCGSRFGDDPAFRALAATIGREIGQRGWQLVYGGGNVGLMGVVADAALAAGGRVVGIIPQALVEREVGHQGLSEQHVVQTMHERKRMMAERSQAFLALPGGIGTMDELFEIWTWRQLGYHDQPIGLLDCGGYYEALIAFMQRMVERGFLSAGQLEAIEIGSDPVAMLDRLFAQAAAAAGADNYRST
jgi:uncharacterized protein (TIGR00730 family)